MSGTIPPLPHVIHDTHRVSFCWLCPVCDCLLACFVSQVVSQNGFSCSL